METNAVDQGIENFQVFIKLLLFELAEKCEDKKDIFLKNALAKTSSLLNSIDNLYKSENYFNGWILYRALTDRLAACHDRIRNAAPARLVAICFCKFQAAESAYVNKALLISNVIADGVLIVYGSTCTRRNFRSDYIWWHR